jgi:hypothetical protein
MVARAPRQVWVLPCRDPVGLTGFRHALGRGLAEGTPSRGPYTVS